MNSYVLMCHCAGADLYVGAGGTCPLPQIHLLPPPLRKAPIQKLADRSYVIFEVPKCSKMQIFRGSVPDPTEGAHSAPQFDLLADGEEARCSPPKNPTPALGPSGLIGLISTGLRG